MGHVQDTPVSTSMISNECMICHMKVYIVSYNLDQIFFSKSKIHIMPNYEQTDLKTAIVAGRNPLIDPSKYLRKYHKYHVRQQSIITIHL